jgi:Ca2+-binding RTX toxin-like protein
MFVSTSQELATALKSVVAGQTILLASGNYDALVLSNFNKAEQVTIRSSNEKAPAVFSELKITNSSNIAFQNIELDASRAKADNPVQILNSKNVSISDSDFHGSLDGVVGNDVAAMLIRSSENVTIKSSEFQQFKFGIGHLDSNGLTLSGNSFHDIQSDGIRGGGSSNVTISNNRFSDFFPVDGDHPDAIQFWTAGTRLAATNIVVTNNVVERGAGSGVQGIFLRDEIGTMPFSNVTITNNQIIGGGFNGISVGNVKKLVIAENTVAAIDDQRSWIRVEKATEAVLTHNRATEFVTDDSVITRHANVLINSLTTRVMATNIFDAEKSSIFGLIQNRAFIDAAANDPFFSNLKLSTVVMQGTDGNDRLTAGKQGQFELRGGAGDDLLYGNGTAATMHGGTGDDSYIVYGAGDVLVENAGSGYDTVTSSINFRLGENFESLRMAVGGLIGEGNEQANRMFGSAGDDTLMGFGGDDVIQGDAGNDALYGNEGNDRLFGDAGDDRLYAGAGDDTLSGGAGSDQLFGESGKNILEGGAGADRLYGGTGQDSFSYRNGDFAGGVQASIDDIFNFSAAQKDKIHLGMIDANSKTAADDAFKFIGNATFHKIAGELRVEVIGKDSYVLGDTNGDGVADLKIHVIGVTNLLVSDFML